MCANARWPQGITRVATSTPVLQAGQRNGLVPKSRSKATSQLASFSRGAGGGGAPSSSRQRARLLSLT